jgi:hypothetical protein
MGTVLYRMDALAHAPHAPAAEPAEAPKRKAYGGTPDLSLANAVEVIKHSRWAKIHRASRDDCIQELRDKLALGSLDVWGEPKGEGKLQCGFAKEVWGVWGLDPDTNTATQNGEPVLTRVQFSSHYVRALWMA